MPNPTNVGGVIGTDNQVPILDDNRLSREWDIDEIYLGGPGANKHVVKQNDLVRQVIGRTIKRYVITDINPSTYVPTLEAVMDNNDEVDDELDRLLATGPRRATETYRLYLDKSVYPYSACVDARLKVGGSQCNHAKIFKGSDLSETGHVISQIYDTSGNLVSENIPLEKIATQIVNNVSIKVVPPSRTVADLEDGELVTIVFYNANGNKVSKEILYVENTTFIRPLENEANYIVGISVSSPFISISEPDVIRYPLNVPIEGFNLMGTVHYHNGDKISYPVDGTRFQLLGMEQFLATQSGQKNRVYVRYQLGDNEYNYSGNVGPGEKAIMQEFKAITLNADGSYGIKLIPSLVWMGAIIGWRIKWWMYNLNREYALDVSNYVTINTNYSAFDPKLYGVLQHLNVSINLKDVNTLFKNYTHTQNIDIVLERQGTERVTNWSVGFSQSQMPRYGVDLHLKARKIAMNNFEVKIDSGRSTLSEWLRDYYYATQPLYDPSIESKAPEPTHFNLIIGDNKVEYSVDKWNSTLTWMKDVVDYSTAHIQFIKKTGNGNLHLSVAPIPVYYVDNIWVPILY